MAIPVFIAETNSNRSARPANLRQVFAVIMRWKSRPWPEICDSRTHASTLGWQLSTWNGWTPMMSRSQMQLGGALGSMRPFVHEPFPRVISKQGRSPHPGHWTRWSDKTLAEKHWGNYVSPQQLSSTVKLESKEFWVEILPNKTLCRIFTMLSANWHNYI